jgi:hypothetical protein
MKKGKNKAVKNRVKSMLEKYRKREVVAQDGLEEVPATPPVQTTPPVETPPVVESPAPSDLGGGMAAGVAEQIRKRHEALGNLKVGTSKVKKKMGGLRGC